MAYVGASKQQLRNGHGTYTFPHGGMGYFADFVNGEMDGMGLRKWPNGDSYSGQFHCGERHGEGVFLSPNTGKRYDGHWECNQRSGHGELVNRGESVYTGAFERHKPHGIGKLVMPTGEFYEGEWQHGCMTCKGVLCDRLEKTLYEGEWLDGERKGSGAGILMDVRNLEEGDSDGELWYEGTWRVNQPTVAKLVQPMSSSVADSEPNDQERGNMAEAEQQEDVLLDLPLALTIENKQLPHPVVQSVCNMKQGEGEGIVVLHSESGRCIRMRIFEGHYIDENNPSSARPASAAKTTAKPPLRSRSSSLRDEEKQQKGDEQEATLSLEEAKVADAFDPTKQESLVLNDANQTLESGDAGIEVMQQEQEQRVDNVSVSNSGGKASFVQIDLPASTLLGNCWWTLWLSRTVVVVVVVIPIFGGAARHDLELPRGFVDFTKYGKHVVFYSKMLVGSTWAAFYAKQ
ncbi:Radial spoke head 10 family protein, partial [Globisporangium splendens]